MRGRHIGSYVGRIPWHCRAKAATKEVTMPIATTRLTSIAGRCAVVAGLWSRRRRVGSRAQVAIP